MILTYLACMIVLTWVWKSFVNLLPIWTAAILGGSFIIGLLLTELVSRKRTKADATTLRKRTD